MKNSKQKQWLSFLLALIMLVGLLPFSVLSVGAESGGEETTSTSRGAARASSSSYPTLTNLVEGTEIIYGHVYFFYKSGRVERRSVIIDPEDCKYNTNLREGYQSETGLQRVVSYDNGILMYWSRFENDFLDLSGLEGRSLTLVLFDNLKLSALYAPGVDLKLMVTDGVNVTFNHSTRYKNKTAYCPQNGATGAVIDLAQSEGSLNGCGTFELCGNGKLSIVTTKAPRKTSPDYAIVAKNTSVLEDAALHIVCGNSHRDVSSLIQTITLTIDTTRDVSLSIKNSRTNAAAWSCHMNNFKLLNAKSLNVCVQRGSGGWILFGNNGETDPAKVFKNYRSSGKIGREWYIAGRTDSSGYNLTLDRRDYMPQIRFNLNLKEVKGGQTVRGLKAGLGYEMSADIVYMPQWMQKLRDAGRVRFYFYGLLCKPGQQEGYEEDPYAYTYDFYVDRTGKHGVEFYWACRPSIDSNYVRPMTEESVLYQTHIEFDVQMNESVSVKQYINNVQLRQAGGEFTEATNATHKISLDPATLAKCYTDESYSTGIPSEWRYLADEDAYIMYFWVRPRHGYEFADSTATADNGVTLNVQHTKVTRRSFTKYDKYLTVNLVAKRKLTDVRGTLKNFRYGADSFFTEIVSNEPKKYTFKNTLVHDDYDMEAGYINERDMYVFYFDVAPGVGYYLPEDASVKVIRPAGYGYKTVHDPLTYDTLYKGDWYDYSPINQKYRTERWMDATSQLKEYGTNIRIKEPVPGDRPAADDSYAKPTRLPLDMKVVSMQWLGPDHKPMGINDKFEIGKEYTLDLRIGFEGGEEMGQVYPINYRDFKVNGKSTSSDAWIIDDYTLDYTNWHVWEFYGSYKVTDPNASGSVSGTVKNYNSAADKVIVQLIQQGYAEPAYETIVPSGTKEGNQYTASYSISGIASGTYTMRVMKNKHVTREYTVTVSGDAKTQNAQIHLLGDVNGDGRVNAMDYTRLLKHVNKTQPLTDAYALKRADVNKDSRVNAMDYTRLLKHVNKTQPLW
ncbi:MAG: dockerin type I repeat-containing protein [Firmicutes bacterium]|nr:dockerin type I repeat-containing protein [Bacillota bacterium]